MILIDEPKIELYEGDCIEIMKSMLDNSVDCIITDPPYNISKEGSNITRNYKYYFLWNELFDQNNTSASIVSDTSVNIGLDTSIVRESVLKESDLNNNIAKEKKQTLTPEERNNVIEIITYLNNKAFKNYQKDNNKTIQLLKALFKYYTNQNIKDVIDLKSNAWYGDEKMEKYIRPETLFNFNKFESYFNELPYEKRNKTL